jgi:4-amino-4-deoxy-L-arabinose transferase-like glycosyltransferase
MNSRSDSPGVVGGATAGAGGPGGLFLAPVSTSTPRSRQCAAWVILLVAVCALTLFANLGGKGLWGADESREAERAREMVGSLQANRQWMTPTYLGRPSFVKPPVHYWIMAGAGLLFGPSDTSFRIPVAGFGLATVLLTFALGSHLYGARAGGIAGIVLATSYLFAFYARTAFVDVPLLACITGAISAGHRALEMETRWTGPASLAAILLAAGTVEKGLAGLVLPLLVLVVGGSVAGRWRRLAAVAGLAGVLAAPLYIWVGAAFTGRFLMFDHFQRFFVPEAVLGGNHPTYFYLPALLGNFIPWTILLPAAAIALACTPGALRRWRLPVAWFGVTFLVLNLGANKRESYLLPLFPALALLLGVVADEVLAGRARASLQQWWRWCLTGLGASCALAGVLLPVVWPTRLGTPNIYPWGAIIALTGTWLVLCSWRRAEVVALVAAGLLAVGITQLLVWQLLPAMNITRSGRQAAEIIRAAAGSAPLAVLPDVHPGLVFYLDLPRPAEATVSLERLPETLRSGRLVLGRERDLSRLQTEWRATVRATVLFQKEEYLLLSIPSDGD